MINLNILTPDESVYQGEVISVTVPGSSGSFQILKDHAPIISTLADGKVTVQAGTTELSYQISGGVVEVSENKVILLAESVNG